MKGCWPSCRFRSVPKPRELRHRWTGTSHSDLAADEYICWGPKTPAAQPDQRENSSRRPRGASGRPGQTPGIQRWELIALAKVAASQETRPLRSSTFACISSFQSHIRHCASRIIVRSRLHFLFLYYRVDFRDVSSGELHDCGFSLVGLIRGHEDVDAARFCLSERIRQIRHFITGHFPAVRIRKVTVGNERGQLPELRFDPYSPISFRRPSDFDARCARFIRDDPPLGEGNKAAHKSIHSVLRGIDPILRDCLERSIRWRGGVPVQLCVYATRPLNDCVSANRVAEGSDYDIRARGLGGADCLVHISDQIACALQPE